MYICALVLLAVFYRKRERKKEKQNENANINQVF